MKKIILLLLCCLIFTGCTIVKTETTQPPYAESPSSPISETTQSVETTVTAIPLNIFVPDDNAESFSTIPTVIDLLDANLILSLLTEYSMLDEGIMLNSIELTGTQLNLDFNQAFLDQLCTYGTAGERMMIGCVVNTFLSAYDAETVYITVNGEIMESGHVIYDFPLEFYN